MSSQSGTGDPDQRVVQVCKPPIIQCKGHALVRISAKACVMQKQPTTCRLAELITRLSSCRLSLTCCYRAGGRAGDVIPKLSSHIQQDPDLP